MTKGSNESDAKRAEERRLLREKVERLLAEAREAVESGRREIIKIEVLRELSER